MAWLRGVFSARSSDGSDGAAEVQASKAEQGQATATILPVGLAPSEGEAASRSDPAQGPLNLRPGEFVEYYSATVARWIPARVLKVNPRGTYKLDCKPDVSAEKIRRPVPRADREPVVLDTGIQYAVGDRVEYFSTTTKGWIPAKVVARTPVGTYDLDCKPDVRPDKIRKAGFGPRGGREDAGGRRQQASSSRAAPTSDDAGPVPSPVLPTPLQLIRVARAGQGWRYEVCDEAAQLLERQGSRSIAVASVCGMHQSGKSFLLNLLFERAQRGEALFQVGGDGTADARTQGLWLWGSLAAEEEEWRQSGADPRSPLLAFVDSEGFGGGDSTRDAHLMTLCALVSSVLVLNTTGALSENLFSTLALTCRFAEHIEDGASESSRPSLLWLLRDFAPQLLNEAAGGEGMTSADEYMEQALCQAPAVSQSLSRFCGWRTCQTLVRPLGEEEDVQSLAALPSEMLRDDFRVGLNAFRATLVSSCRANPKSIGGQPLGCAAFVALLRQLVAALNAGRMISVTGAWDTVQHASCGNLSDELRKNVCLRLRKLASGEILPTGEKLPLTDESLRAVFDREREQLRAQWDERAVGVELIKREYWRELEASVAREESGVRMQNARAGDRELKPVLDSWQAWLDDDGAAAWEASGAPICHQLASLMDSAPGPPLSRAARRAIEAAGQRLAETRTVLASSAGGGGAASAVGVGGGGGEGGEGASRAELEEAREAKRRASQAEQAARAELETKSAELLEMQAALEAAATEAEALLAREREAKALQREAAEREASMRAELERVRVASAVAESERSVQESINSDRLRRENTEEVAERGRLTAQVEDLLRERDELRASAAAAAVAVASATAASSDRSAGEEPGTGRSSGREAELQQALEGLHAAEGRLRKAQTELQGKEEELRATKTALDTAMAQAAVARQRASEEGAVRQAELLERESALRADLDRLAAAASKADQDRLAAVRATRAAQWEADAAAEEAKRLKDELDHVRGQAEMLGRQLASERQALHGAHEQARAAHFQAVEAHRRRLEEDDRAHNDALEGTRNKLLDRERSHGLLEGRIEALTLQANHHRDQVTELQSRLRDVEREKGQHLQEKENLRWDLRSAQEEARRAAERAKDAEKLQREANENAKRLEDEMRSQKPPKCGCAVQ